MVISSGIAIIEEATDYFPKRDSEITTRLQKLVVDFWVHEVGVDVPQVKP